MNFWLAFLGLNFDIFCNWVNYFFRLYDLQSDVIAGLTVALTVIPQGLAYANIANLDSQVYVCFL